MLLLACRGLLFPSSAPYRLLQRVSLPASAPCWSSESLPGRRAVELPRALLLAARPAKLSWISRAPGSYFCSVRAHLSPMVVCRSTLVSFPQSQLVVFPCAHAARSRVPMLAWPVPARTAIISELPAMRSPSSDFIARSLVRHPVLLHGWPMLLHWFALAVPMAGAFSSVARVPSSLL